MKKLVLGAAIGTALIGQFWLGQSAEARPGYLKAFQAKYPALEAASKEAKCNVCHFGEEKKNRNDYGAAMGNHLGGKNIKDTAAVDAALGKTEADKSTGGKTFGELIKEGKLPGSK